MADNADVESSGHELIAASANNSASAISHEPLAISYELVLDYSITRLRRADCRAQPRLRFSSEECLRARISRLA
jgi:hypothetical protein